MDQQIKRVLIAGGTHGNELIGIALCEKFKQRPELIYRPSFETLTLQSNPRAIAACVRYIDKDLNRCFEVSEREPQTQYELQLAQKIRAQFGPTGQQPVEVCVDLHGTTANMGVTLILDNLEPWTLKLAAHLSAIRPEIKLYSSAASGRYRDSLRSIAPHRFAIEVGPVAHGTLHAELFQKTETLIYTILDYLDQQNRAAVALDSPSLTLYQYINSVDYPRDEKGKLRAMVHPHLQFQDYEALHPGDPMFLTFDGEVIPYAGNAIVYPVFINEAAYYEKGIALCLTEKRQIQV
jgi:succinylglutamate desuccinylase